jgi:phenylalanyl-tRNA synthetase beta chain
VRIFEIGRVFRRDASVADSHQSVAGLDQPLRIAGLAYGNALPLQWAEAERTVDFFDVKGEIETLLAPRKACFVAAEHPAMHPGRCARIEVDGELMGHVGELHPRWRQGYELPQAPVLFELDAALLQRRPLPAPLALPRQLPVSRDLALVAGEGVGHDALLAAIHAAPHEGLLRQALLFDVYRPKTASAEIGAGERSMAVRLELLDDQAPLTEERIDSAVHAVLAHLQTTLAVRLRG